MAELNEKDVSVTELTDEGNNETTGISELHSGIPISLLFVSGIYTLCQSTVKSL